jgi:hypothetical protein
MRRIVTGTVDGVSRILADGEPANMHQYAGWPGHMTSLVWATAASAQVPLQEASEPLPGAPIGPEPGGTSLLIVRFPPDAIFGDPRFDPARYGEEAQQHLSGLIETFEPEGNGFLTPRSVDYDIVLLGEIWLELDAGEVHLKQGDIVVQGGTRHAWRNRGQADAVMAFVLVGAAAPA